MISFEKKKNLHNMEHELKKAEPKEGPDTRGKGFKLSRRDLLKIGIFLGPNLVRKPERAAALIEKYLEDQREKGPRIKIHVFYSPHGTVEDVKGLESEIKKADILALEFFGWKKKQFDNLALVARGEMTPEEFCATHGIEPNEGGEEFQPYQLSVLGALYKSGKLVTSFDVPEKDPLSREVNRSREALIDFDLKTDFTLLLNFRRERLQNFSVRQIKREDYILRKVEEFQKSVAKGMMELPTAPANTEAGQWVSGIWAEHLRDKDVLKTVFLIGTAHPRIYQHLRRASEDMSRTLPEMPYTPGELTEEAVHRFIFGEEVSDELIGRTLLEDLIRPQAAKPISQETPSSHKRALRIREMAERFSLDEIKDIFDEIRTELNKDNSPFSGMTVSIIILRRLREKGITVPLPKIKNIKEAEGTITF